MVCVISVFLNTELLFCFIGGYNLSSICDASEQCTRALLGENVPLPNQEEILRLPCKAAIQTLEECSRVQGMYALRYAAVAGSGSGVTLHNTIMTYN